MCGAVSLRIEQHMIYVEKENVNLFKKIVFSWLINSSCLFLGPLTFAVILLPCLPLYTLSFFDFFPDSSLLCHPDILPGC